MIAESPELLDEAAGAWMRTLLLRDYNTRVVVPATALLGLACGAVGTFTLLRRRALMGDALSHAMLPGIGIAFLLAPWLAVEGKSLPLLLGGATISGILGTLTILLIRHRTRLAEDAGLGIVLSVYFGVGMATLGMIQQSAGGHAAGLESFIYGKTASIVASDAYWIAAAALLTVGLIAVGYKELKLLCFDESYAAARGFPTLLLDIVLMAAVVGVTVVGLQAVGLLLMVALLVIPAGAARFWTDSTFRMTVLSAGLGGAGCMIGALLSAAVADLPSGATIVLVSATFFFISFLFGTRRGIWVLHLQHRRRRRQAARHHLLRALYELLESEAPDGPDRMPNPPAAAIENLRRMRSWSSRELAAALRRCRAGGLVTYDRQSVRLTERGWAEAKRLTREHRLWELYLITHADIAPTRVDRDAERIEHVLDPAMIELLESLLEAEVTPRGDRVPQSPHELGEPVGPAASASLPSEREAPRNDV